MNQLPMVFIFVLIEIVLNLFASKALASEVTPEVRPADYPDCLTESVDGQPQTVSTEAIDLAPQSIVSSKNKATLQSSTGNRSCSEAQPFSPEPIYSKPVPSVISTPVIQPLNRESPKQLQAQSSDQASGHSGFRTA